MSVSKRSCAWAAATSIALITASLALSPAHAAGDPARAGGVIRWVSPGAPANFDLPAEFSEIAIAEVEPYGEGVLALTTSGRVLTSDSTSPVPSSLASESVTSIEASPSGRFALTASGKTIGWGLTDLATPPDGLNINNLRQIEMGTSSVVALTEAGGVIAWGAGGQGETTVPVEAQSGVTKIALAAQTVYALKSDGSIIGWGSAGSSAIDHIPTVAEGVFVDIGARNNGGLALRADGTLESWGLRATAGLGTKLNLPPASVTDKTVTSISTSDGVNVATDSDGGIHVWGTASNLPTNVPEGLDGRTISDHKSIVGQVYAVQTKVLPISTSTVAGIAKVGSKLTGTPATFSGGPEVTHQWLANGAPIAGATATTFTLTAAQVGKKVSFRTIAAKNGDSIFSDSPATATVAALAPAKVSSKTAISKPKVKKTKASFTVKVTRSGGTPTGKVKITVKRGAKKVYSKSVALKKGVAKVALKKLKKGKHKVTASYAGDSRSKSSSAKAQTFRVK